MEDVISASFVRFFNAIVAFLKQIALYILEGIFYLLQFTLYTLVDGFLTVITSFFYTLDGINNLSVFIADWTGLPPAMGYIIAETGIPSCIALLLSAIVIRVLINLIPSWATRV